MPCKALWVWSWIAVKNCLFNQVPKFACAFRLMARCSVPDSKRISTREGIQQGFSEGVQDLSILVEGTGEEG